MTEKEFLRQYANKVVCGKNIDVMKEWPDNSVDSIVTDPPYGLLFMGKRWDYDVPTVPIWEECFRVLKPGGFLLSFFGTRTYHRGVVKIEDAGFEIRDQIGWAYGSGFPKSMDVSKAIDKAAGAEREVAGDNPWAFKGERNTAGANILHAGEGKSFVRVPITAPATEAAKQWQGWGTALKPAWEPIVVARKPLVGTVAENVLKYGTGGLNIDGCRIGIREKEKFVDAKRVGSFGGNAQEYKNPKVYERSTTPLPPGRWPANLIHDGSEEVVGLFPESKAGQTGKPTIPNNPIKMQASSTVNHIGHNDSGSAARFFYCAKASKKERTCGGKVENKHPTVKPLALMRYLCRLVTPPGGVVLDPFCGSGSTLLAARDEWFIFVGIDMDPESCHTAEQRLEATNDQA